MRRDMRTTAASRFAHEVENVKEPQQRHSSAKVYLGWPDICEMFGCGRSKAMLLMHEVGVIHVGRSVFVRASDLDDYLAEHGGIDVTWPKSGVRRKVVRHG